MLERFISWTLRQIALFIAPGIVEDRDRNLRSILPMAPHEKQVFNNDNAIGFAALWTLFFVYVATAGLYFESTGVMAALASGSTGVDATAIETSLNIVGYGLCLLAVFGLAAGALNLLTFSRQVKAVLTERLELQAKLEAAAQPANESAEDLSHLDTDKITVEELRDNRAQWTLEWIRAEEEERYSDAAYYRDLLDGKIDETRAADKAELKAKRKAKLDENQNDLDL